MRITIKIISYSLIFTFLTTTSLDAFAIVARHTSVRHAGGHRHVHTTKVVAHPVKQTTVAAHRVWVPGHYYHGVWVAGAYISVHCVHWVPGHYYKGRWIEGYCAD